MNIQRRSMLSLLGAFAGFAAFGARISAAVAALTKADGKAIEAALGLPVTVPGDGARYLIARDIWNGFFDKKNPAFIVTCGSADDVSRCIQYARENKIPLSVKSGGHHPAGLALREGGMTIDLSGMMDIQIDESQKRATVGPGVRIGHLQTVLEPLNLFAVGAMTSTVGMAGMTMGGGYGWFSGEAGFAVDNLLSAEIVTADGKIRKIDENNEPDLFWAIRGGGGNFGVVTSLVIRVHPLSPLTGGLLVYAGPDAKPAVQGWHHYCQSPLPGAMMPALILTPSEQDISVPAAIFMVKSGLQGKASEDAFATLRSFGKPALDTIRPVSLTEVQTFADLDGEPGYRYAVLTHFLKDLPEEAIDIMIEAIANAPSPKSMVLWGPQHGATRAHGPTDTAFYHRESIYNGFILSRWSEPDEDQKNIAWVRQLWNDLKPFSTGQVFMNFISETDEKWAAISYGGNQTRLEKIKFRYDPDNIFSSTVNITPRA